MRIQNKNLASSAITLRYTSHKGERVSVKGDERGIFDVPQEDAEFLLTTPGWTAVREATALEPVPPVKPEPPAAPKPPFKPAAPGAPVPAAAKPAEPPAQPPPPPAASSAEDSAAEAVAKEIDSLRSKADALAFAELHGIEGLNSEMKLSEMKEKLTSELLVSEED